MKARLDMKRIARGLRARRTGRVTAAGGYFGAVQLAAEVQARRRSDDDRDHPSTAAARRASADGEV
jgi:hypothetical protein